MRPFLNRLYRGWMKFAHGLGRVQTYLILSIIYFVAIGLMSPLIRLFVKDPLSRRDSDAGSAWASKERTNLCLDEARRLF